MARPTKLDEDTQAAIVRSLAIGATRKDSAEAAGVRYMTFLNWMAAGESAKRGKFFEFFDACSKAEAQAKLKYTNTIAKAAADGDWRAAMEFLKRRDRETWGDNTSVAGGSNRIDVSSLSDDELQAIASGQGSGGA
jgi:hypothetical protein